MKAVSGLISRMHCRKGAKSGLASGIRSPQGSAPLLCKAHPESRLRFNARRPVVN